MNKLKIGIIVAVIGVMVSSVVFAANLVSEVYFSNFKIKLNGAEYSPEMPVLNYLGRTYLALRELGTVTGNEIDFVNNEIIINNGEKETEQPKHVVQQEVIFNNQKHNIQIKFYKEVGGSKYNEGDKVFEDYEAVAKVFVDNNYIGQYEELATDLISEYEGKEIETPVISDYDGYELETYIINDTATEYQYLVLYLYTEDTRRFYIIDNGGHVVDCITDMQCRDWKGVFLKEEMESNESELNTKITKYGIEVCYPISQPGEEWPVDGDVDWCKAIHTIKYGVVTTNILKIYDKAILESVGVHKY